MTESQIMRAALGPVPLDAYSGEDAKAIVDLIAAEEYYSRWLDEVLQARAAGAFGKDGLDTRVMQIFEAAFERILEFRAMAMLPDEDEHSEYLGAGT